MRDTAISLLRLFARAAARSMTVAELDEAIGLARELQASGEFPDGNGPGDDVLPVLEQERAIR